MSNNTYNFNPGPAALPKKIIEQVKDEFVDYDKTGISIVEISHRSKNFEQVINNTVVRVKRLASLSDDFSVLFMQGGASSQFALVPMNLCNGKKPAYINTGTWSTKSIDEAKHLDFDPDVITSSEDKQFTYIPEHFQVPGNAAYLHITSNNTTRGTQWSALPDCSVPLVVDMSSDIFSRPNAYSDCGLIYAGAQKNLGPAGVTLVIIRKDLLERTPQQLPTMFRYTTYANKNSLYNTPPCFSIYMTGLVLKWIEEDMGGLEGIDSYNNKKAQTLYNFLDEHSDFYEPIVEKKSRSLMNVIFKLADLNLEIKFLEDGYKNGFCGLKGYRLVGGCRASIYNAVTLEAVNELVKFMSDFMQRHG